MADRCYDLLKRYMRAVNREEGVCFLYEEDWSRQDWLTLKAIEREILAEESQGE